VLAASNPFAEKLHTYIHCLLHPKSTTIPSPYGRKSTSQGDRCAGAGSATVGVLSSSSCGGAVTDLRKRKRLNHRGDGSGTEVVFVANSVEFAVSHAVCWRSRSVFSRMTVMRSQRDTLNGSKRPFEKSHQQRSIARMTLGSGCE